MMKYSERSALISANVKPAVKQTLREHIKRKRANGEKDISLSRWVDEAIGEKLAREGIRIAEVQLEPYTGEALPFVESTE